MNRTIPYQENDRLVPSASPVCKCSRLRFPILGLMLLSALTISQSVSSQCLQDLTDTESVQITACSAQGPHPASDAFDNDDLAFSGWISNFNPAPSNRCYIRVRFNNGPRLVRGYSITAIDDNSGNTDMAPRDWSFQGSPNGSTWITLDDRNNEVFSNPGETHIYSFNNATPYRYYRLNIGQTQNTGANVAIGEIQLFAEVCLEGTVFRDNGDRNPAYNPINDVPVAGVKVSIVTNPAGNVHASRITNGLGQYAFPAGDVPAVGSFTVMIIPPADMIFATKPADVWSTWMSIPAPQEEPATGALFFDYHESFDGDRTSVNRMRFPGGNIDFGLANATPPEAFACNDDPFPYNLISIANQGTFGPYTYNWERAHPHQERFAYSSNVLYTSMPVSYTDYGFSNQPGTGSTKGVLLGEGRYTVTAFLGTLSDISYKPYTNSLLNNVRGGWRKSYGVTTGDAYDRFLAVNGATAGSLPFFKQSGVSLVGGDLYSIAFYGKHANSYQQVSYGGVNDGQIVVEVLDASNAVVTSGSLPLTPPTSYNDDLPEAPWQLRTFSFTAPGGGGPFTIQLRASTISSYGNDFYIDNVLLYPCNDVLLPLDILHFSATRTGQDNAEIKWEINKPEAATAELEYSQDGANFSKLNTSAIKSGVYHYSYIHPKPGLRIHFYRLKIIDRNGKATYSEVKRVDMHQARPGNSVILYPNPVKDLFTVQAQSMITGIEIIDQSGKVVRRFSQINGFSYSINRNGLPGGMYYVKVSCGQDLSLHKLVVEK